MTLREAPKMPDAPKMPEVPGASDAPKAWSRTRHGLNKSSNVSGNREDARS